MIVNIKKIIFKISIPLSGLAKGKEFCIEVNDNATFVQALAMVDKFILEHPEESIFPIYKDFRWWIMKDFLKKGSFSMKKTD